MYKSLPSHLHPYSQQIISLGKQDHYREVCFPTFHLEAGSPYPLDLFSVPAHPVSVEEGSFSHLKRNPLFTTSSCYFSISVHSLFSFNAHLSLHAAPFPQICMYPQTATTLKKKKNPRPSSIFHFIVLLQSSFGKTMSLILHLLLTSQSTTIYFCLRPR